MSTKHGFEYLDTERQRLEFSQLAKDVVDAKRRVANKISNPLAYSADLVVQLFEAIDKLEAFQSTKH